MHFSRKYKFSPFSFYDFIFLQISNTFRSNFILKKSIFSCFKQLKGHLNFSMNPYFHENGLKLLLKTWKPSPLNTWSVCHWSFLNRIIVRFGSSFKAGRLRKTTGEGEDIDLWCVLCVSSCLSPLYSPVAFCGAPLGPSQKRIQDLSLNSMIGKTHSHIHGTHHTVWHNTAFTFCFHTYEYAAL